MMDIKLKLNLNIMDKIRMPSFVGRMNVHSVLAIAGALGPLILTVGDLTAGLSNPDYSIIRNSISSLALTHIGWLQTIGFLALGLLVEIFTAGLLFNVKRARGFHLGIGIMVFVGFGLLLIGAFRTDAVGAARTIEGTIHGLTATGVFWLFPIAILVLGRSIKNDPRWKPLFRYTLVTGILAFVFGITLLIIPDDSSVFGLLERLLVVNMILWVEIAAIRLFWLSVNRGEKVVNKE